jgi:hypothetical protein
MLLSRQQPHISRSVRVWGFAQDLHTFSAYGSSECPICVKAKKNRNSCLVHVTMIPHPECAVSLGGLPETSMKLLVSFWTLLLRIPHVGLALAAPTCAKRLLHIYVRRREVELQQEQLKALSVALEVSKSFPQQHRREVLAAIVGQALAFRVLPSASRKRKR